MVRARVRARARVRVRVAYRREPSNSFTNHRALIFSNCPYDQHLGVLRLLHHHCTTFMLLYLSVLSLILHLGGVLLQHLDMFLLL